MITDVEQLRQPSTMNLEGVKAFGDAHKDKVDYQYYQPFRSTTAAYVSAIELNIEEGANVIVTPGYYFSGMLLVKWQ